jgi:putative alpha-1,2-mannosidase
MKLHLPNGKIFEMKAHNLSDVNKYIQFVRLNGKPLKSASITYAEINNGGILEFEMTDERNSNFMEYNHLSEN